MEPDKSKLPPDQRSWLERPKNKPTDAGLIAVMGGICFLVVMVYFAMHPPVFDFGFGELKDFSGASESPVLVDPTQVFPVETTPWKVKEIPVTTSPTPVITQSNAKVLGPIVLHPGSRVVAVTVDKRKYNQVFFYYTRNDNPSLEITAFTVEMMNAGGQYSGQTVRNPVKWQDTYLDQIKPSTGKDLVVVNAYFNDGVVQTVLMNYI
jgi:hypothetical protein